MAEKARYSTSQTAGKVGRKARYSTSQTARYGWQKRPGTVQVRQPIWLAEKAKYSTSQTAGMVDRKGQVQYKSDS